ncbi:hypothetical protein BWI15_04955 [Kribbella sp. ALI-6-A]|uniref:hypothetical protein n=1 Tax=Kribbella sp. ALI-6-A TaxID=1933817 RepID=UPI00097C83D0|nr:hypothetical protein [Kribbella sp. ALI-6-A]ONI76648.1 hypothetical protein BWI15_04955 [Kribbella sp. ALI-6-A]
MAEIVEGQRVSSSDYGRGTVAAVFGTEVQVLWDAPLLEGTTTRLFTHDRAFVERLTQLRSDDDGRESPA